MAPVISRMVRLCPASQTQVSVAGAYSKIVKVGLEVSALWTIATR